MSSLRSYGILIVPANETRTIQFGQNVLVYYVVAGHNWNSGLFLLELNTISFIKEGTDTVEVTCPSNGIIQFKNKHTNQASIHYFYIKIQ